MCRRVLICVTFAFSAAMANHSIAQVSQIDPADLTTTSSEDFSSLPDGVLNGLLALTGFTVGERFQGQTIDPVATDQLLGTPSSPLTIVAGPNGENLFVFNEFGSPPPVGFEQFNVVAGMDSFGDAGDGAVSFLFDDEQLEVGIFVWTTSAAPVGPVTVDFFDASGSGLGSFTLSNLDNETLGFRSTSANIAGFSMTHTGTGGFAVGNLHFNAVPEPSTYALVAFAIIGGLGYWQTKRLAMEV